MPKLEELNLNNNQIGDEGAVALAEAVGKGALPKLSRSTQSSRRQPDWQRGRKALAEAVKAKPELGLILCNNKLSQTAKDAWEAVEAKRSGWIPSGRGAVALDRGISDASVPKLRRRGAFQNIDVPSRARMSSFHIDPRHGHVHAPSWHGRPQIKHVWPKLVNSYLKSETVRSIGRLGFYSGSQNGEDAALHTQFFDDNEPATFVEMGALDGLKYSNTLAFERALNWRGVLIEANPAMCELLFYTTAHNRTRSQPLCTGVSKNYSRLQMEKGAFLSTYGEVNEMDSLHLKFHQRIGRYQQDFVPSAPLGQLLRMAGLASIDLFSLGRGRLRAKGAEHARLVAPGARVVHRGESRAAAGHRRAAHKQGLSAHAVASHGQLQPRGLRVVGVAGAVDARKV